MLITVSANIICKNEKDNVLECIESIKPYVDEIVVLDTGSTDGTIEILKTLDVKLFQKEWTDDFSEMRNYCKSVSTGDWILVIDADMTLLNFQRPDFKADYYTGDVTILTSTNNLVAFPMIALFKKEFNYYGKRHATIEMNLKGRKGEHINIVYSHPELSKEEITSKMKHNLGIHLEQLKSEPDNIGVIYHLFRTYYYLKDYDNAIKYGIEVLNSSLNVQTKAMTGIFLFLCYSLKGFEKDGITYLLKSIELMPYQVFGRLLMFNLFCDLKAWGLASETLAEIKLFSSRGKSDLPCDYFLNQKQIEELEIKLKNNE